MKSFYNKRYLSAATALLSAFVLSVACTSVDDTLGAGLIPGGGEKLSSMFFTSVAFFISVSLLPEAYTMSIGSFPSTSTHSDLAKANG